MDSQESTIPNQEQKLDQIIQILGDFRQNVEARLTSLENRMSNLESRIGNLESRMSSLENRMSNVESRVGNLESETKQGFEQMDTRVLALEIQLSNIGSMVDKAISVSYESLSVVKGLRGEVMALRAESAYRNRELDRASKIDQAA